MKISGKRTGKISAKQTSPKAETQKIDKARTVKSSPVQEVEVVISEKSKEIDQAKSIIGSIPELRIEKLSAIKVEIEDGNYHVDSIILAKKIVNEALLESIKRKKSRR